MQALVPAAIDAAFANMPKDERYDAYTRMFLAHDPLGYARIAQGMVGVDLRAALRELAVPTLVAVGRHDPIFTPDLARQVHAHLERTPHAAFHQLDHAAHFPPFQDAQAFSHLVLDFLARWPGGGARSS